MAKAFKTEKDMNLRKSEAVETRKFALAQKSAHWTEVCERKQAIAKNQTMQQAAADKKLYLVNKKMHELKERSFSPDKRYSSAATGVRDLPEVKTNQLAATTRFSIRGSIDTTEEGMTAREAHEAR